MGVIESGDSLLEVIVVKLVGDLNSWSHAPRISERAVEVMDGLASRYVA